MYTPYLQSAKHWRPPWLPRISILNFNRVQNSFYASFNLLVFVFAFSISFLLYFSISFLLSFSISFLLSFSISILLSLSFSPFDLYLIHYKASWGSTLFLCLYQSTYIRFFFLYSFSLIYIFLSFQSLSQSLGSLMGFNNLSFPL